MGDIFLPSGIKISQKLILIAIHGVQFTVVTVNFSCIMCLTDFYVQSPGFIISCESVKEHLEQQKSSSCLVFGMNCKLVITLLKKEMSVFLDKVTQ